MVSHANPECPPQHPKPPKNHIGKCPPIHGKQSGEAWEKYWHRGHGSERDICVHTQLTDDTGAAQKTGWQDTYRCYLGSKKPSKELQKKYGPMGPCHQGAKPSPNLPGVPTPAPPAPGGGGKVTPSTNQCASFLPFGDSSTSNPSLLDDIKYFQEQEMNILGQLQQEAVKASPDENKINTLTSQLKPFQDARVRLMKQLNNISTQTQCSLGADRTCLQDQLTMTLMADQQLKAVEKQTQDVINERNNKQRMVEITNYEYDRFSSHKGIFRTIAFCSLFVLAGIYIGASGNDTFGWLGYPIVVIAIAVAIFLTIKRIWWNYYRSERNWKQFDWDMPHPHGANYETVWQHDKRAFEKAWSDTKYEADQAEQYAEDEYGKAKRDLRKAYKDVKKDVNKARSDVSGALSGATKKGSNQLTNKSARESFAVFR